MKPILVYSEEECTLAPCTHFYCEDEKGGVFGGGRGGLILMGGDGADDFVLARRETEEEIREILARIFAAVKRGDEWIGI